MTVGIFATIYMLFVTKVEKFGMITILATVVGAVMMIAGYGWLSLEVYSESVEGELLLSDSDLTKEQINTYLSDLDLAEFSDDHPMALSGGQKQRVAVAAACVAKKKYLYLDEPTSGLDYTQMKNMSKAIQKIKENVSYVLIVTHEPEFILDCCEYVVEFEKGVIKCTYQLDTLGRERLYNFLTLNDNFRFLKKEELPTNENNLAKSAVSSIIFNRVFLI